MVHLREFRRIRDFISKEYSLTLGDATSFDNFFKSISNTERELEISQDCKLFLEEKTDYRINVKSNCSLTLISNLNERNISNIEINIDESKISNIVLIDNGEMLREINIRVGRESELNLSQINKTSGVNLINIFLNENSRTQFNSSYFGDSSLNYMKYSIVHLGRNSKSNINVNGVSEESSKIIIDAKVRIERDASNSEGFQKINGIIMDEKSSIFAEPILEIENNDVKCSHGTTISRISDDVIYYMKSRGMDLEMSKKIIKEGFLYDLLENVDEEVKEIVL